MEESNQKKEQFRVIIAGSRKFEDYEYLRDACDYYLSDKLKEAEVIVISGHASGADSLGERYAEEKGLKCELFPADWKKYGKSAGYRRNVQMAEVANACICFILPTVECPGTELMLKIARNKNLLVRRVDYKK